MGSISLQTPGFSGILVQPTADWTRQPRASFRHLPYRELALSAINKGGPNAVRVQPPRQRPRETLLSEAGRDEWPSARLYPAGARR